MKSLGESVNKIIHRIASREQRVTEAREETERWAFSRSELRNPEGLNSDDILIADAGPGQELGVQVKRNGEVTNVWEDGTRGVNRDALAWAGDQETLWHPDATEETDEWIDVIVDRQGNFVRFV